MKDEEKSGIVYQIPLKCGKTYVGESGKIWRIRQGQHRSYIRDKKLRDSAILEHLVDCQDTCGIDNPGVKWENCKILGQESNEIKRKALESMYIRKHESSVINRNQGSLDQIWARAIKECNNRKKGDVKSGHKFGHRRARNNLFHVT